MADGQQLLLTSIVINSGQEQTDSVLYDLASGHSHNLTNSPISEYSPTVMPNGIDFSVIHASGEVQKLWRYPLPNTGREPANIAAPSELLAEVNPVGYHAWIDEHRVLLFVLGEPHSLQLASLNTQESTILDRDIGPSLWRVPQSQLLSYTSNKGQWSGSMWTLKTYDPQNGQIQTLTHLPEGAYYYGWSGDSKAIAAQGSILKQWDRQLVAPQWKTFADVKETCPLGVTRLTTNLQNSKIALVCNR